jgi:hypothetical protein
MLKFRLENKINMWINAENGNLHIETGDEIVVVDLATSAELLGMLRQKQAVVEERLKRNNFWKKLF